MTPASRTNKAARGFTLVELLVVIAIIALLLSLLIPGVHSAREAARMTQCRNNAKQIAMSVNNFMSTNSAFPSGGWGHMWIGDPDQGNGLRQPGGWIYQILPHIEQSVLYNLGSGGTPVQKKAAAVTLATTPLSSFYCPSRRAPKLYPHRSDATGQTNRPLNPGIGGERVDFASVQMVARSCYAINGGTSFIGDDGGPATIADEATYAFPNVSNERGIVSFRSEFTPAMVRDGLSNTYLAGERYLRADRYDSYTDGCDAQNMYIGYDQDVARWGSTTNPPVRDRAGLVLANAFGGPHDAGFVMAMCDGSVTSIGYDIDGLVHQYLADRKDGQPVAVP